MDHITIKMDTDWLEFKCKSGQNILIDNKATGEHWWPDNGSHYNSSIHAGSESNVMFGQPVIYKELSTTGTQTDDNGCNNGCTSIYITTDHVSSSLETHHAAQPQPCVLDGSDDNLDCESYSQNALKNEKFDDECKDMDEIAAMLKHLEETYLNGASKIIYTDYHIKENDKSMDTECVLNNASQNNGGHLVADINNNNEQRQFSPGCDQRSDDRKTHVHACSFCNKEFPHEFDLNLHLKTHNSGGFTKSNRENSFKCDYCEKGFTRKNNMKRHVAELHKWNSRLKCSFCSKHFSFKGGLSRHVLRMHTGHVDSQESSSNCLSYYKEKSTRMDNLNCATSMHEEILFQCPCCEKKFLTKYNLNNHVRTHTCTGVKPSFSCYYCKRKFSRKDNLKRHIYHSNTHGR